MVKFIFLIGIVLGFSQNGGAACVDANLSAYARVSTIGQMLSQVGPKMPAAHYQTLTKMAAPYVNQKISFTVVNPCLARLTTGKMTVPLELFGDNTLRFKVNNKEFVPDHSRPVEEELQRLQGLLPKDHVAVWDIFPRAHATPVLAAVVIPLAMVVYAVNQYNFCKRAKDGLKTCKGPNRKIVRSAEDFLVVFQKDEKQFTSDPKHYTTPLGCKEEALALRDCLKAEYSNIKPNERALISAEALKAIETASSAHASAPLKSDKSETGR